MQLRRGVRVTGVSLVALGSLPPGAADAQDTARATVLEEIVVVARRREERLQDLPLSITALTADAMQAEGLYNVEQIGEFVPNLTLATGDRAGQTQIFIRGIGGGGPDPVFPIGTGMYVDGHYIPKSVGGYMSTLDVERIEVLRGPQGTLYGKNTTGGAINIISTKPAPDFESSLRVRAGEYGQQDLRGMVNVPLGDDVFARISAASEQSDGYYYNRYLGTEADATDHVAVTGALRFTPGERWTIDSALSYAENRDREKGGQCTPGPEPFFGGRGVEYGDDAEQTQTYAHCRTDNSFGPFVNSSNKRAYSNVDTEALFVTASWASGGELGGLDNVNVRTSASYRNVEYQNLHDRDYMPMQMFAIGTYGEPRYTLTRSAELLVEGDVSDRLVFVTGLHYFYEETQTGGSDRCYRIFVAEFDPDNPDVDIPCDDFSGTVFDDRPLRGHIGGNNTGVFNTSLGIFGHVTYALDNRWALEAGVRYTEDEREFFNFETDLVNVQTPDPTALSTFDVIMNASNLFAFNDGKATFDDVTATLSLSRALDPGRWLDEGMLYLRFAQGFLTGGFNTELNLHDTPTLAPLQWYGPEHVDNYEIGFKAAFDDGRLGLNAALFYMDYADKQDEVVIDNSDGFFDPDPETLEIGVVANVSEVVIYGLELELRAQPWNGGLVAFDLGYLHNEYGVYDTLDDELNLVDRSHVAISDFSPDWTANWKIEHTFTLGNGATLSPMIGAYWQSEYEWLDGLDLDSPPSFCFEGDYAKWRTRITYEPAAANYQITLYGNNVTDERYYEQCREFRGLYIYRHAPPAAWGIEFSARWGG